MLDKWRLILDPPYSGSRNMAIDTALLSSANTASSPCSTLRLYSWSTPTISIGYRQNPAHFTHLNLPVVKRLTGGRAVLHDSELTYSVTVPKTNPLYGGGISAAYSVISKCLVAALKDVGVEGVDFIRPVRRTGDAEARGNRTEACFLSSSRYEIVVDGKKMVGSAQRRFDGAFLQHGSILTSIDAQALESVFGAGLVDKITWLGAHTESGVEELCRALVLRFEDEMGIRFSEASLTKVEIETVNKELAGGVNAVPREVTEQFAL